MNKPAIGRIVHYKHQNGELYPGIITRVHNETCINLKVFCDTLPDEFRSSSTLGEGPYQWQWPVIERPAEQKP